MKTKLFIQQKVTKSLIAAVCLLFAVPAFSATGKLQVRLRDAQGRVNNGTVRATKAGEEKTCQTKAGVCVLRDLEPGKWEVSAESTGGKKSPIKKKKVSSGKTAKLRLILKKQVESVKVDHSGKGLKKGRKGASQRVAEKEPIAVRSAVPIAKSPLPTRGSPMVETRSLSTGGDKEPQNLASGKNKVAEGSVRDINGRVVNGRIDVKQNSRLVGTSQTASGVYRIYDLPPGTYQFDFESQGGKKKSRLVTVENIKIKKIDFLLQ